MRNRMNEKETNDILEQTRQKIIEDGTIICYNEDPLSDCYGVVSPESIALRELMLYGEFSKEEKDDLLALLQYYSATLEDDLDAYFDGSAIVKKFLPNMDFYSGGEFLRDVLGWKVSEVMEVYIRLVLLEIWRDYEIPSDKYDDIVYSQTNKEPSNFEKLMHNYKCLHNNDLEWDKPNTTFNYEIVVTYKELKTIAFDARDSGSKGDCFGYAHSIIISNIINEFIIRKLGLTGYDYEYPFNYFENNEYTKELEGIADTLYDKVKDIMYEFCIEIY